MCDVYENGICAVKKEQISECVQVIRESFQTVADAFGITAESAPRFTAFSTNSERLYWHLEEEHRPMYAFYDKGRMAGYYSMLLRENRTCELNNLSVLPEYRHKGIGARLLSHAQQTAKSWAVIRWKSVLWRKIKCCGSGMKVLALCIREQRNLCFFRLPAGIWKRKCS